MIVGTPDYYAAEANQLKTWLDTCPCKLADKLCGAYATANFLRGGGDIAIQSVLTQLLVKGYVDLFLWNGPGACPLSIWDPSASKARRMRLQNCSRPTALALPRKPWSCLPDIKTISPERQTAVLGFLSK